jgi:hypothetical protein
VGDYFNALHDSWASLKFPEQHRQPLVRLFVFGLVLTLIANAFDLFAYPFSIDAEQAAFSPDPVSFLGSGRWAAFVLAKYFVSYASIPVVPILIACTTFAASYAVTAYVWSENFGWPHYVAAPFALAFPTLFQLFSFSVISYSVGSGIFLTAIGLYCVTRESWVGFVLGVGFFTFAIGVYQPIALYPSTAFLVYAALGLSERGLGRTGKLFLLFGMVMGLAELLNHEITQAIYRHLGLSGSYVESFFDFDYLRQNPKKVFHQTIAFVVPILTGRGGPFIDSSRVYTATIALACLFALASRARLTRGPVDFGISVALIAAAVALSVIVCVVSYGGLPYRTLLGTPIAIAGVVFCASQLDWRPAVRLLAIASALCFLAFAEIGARLYYGSYIAWLDDRALGEQILTRIDALEDLPTQRPIPIEFSGFHNWPTSDQIPNVGAGSTMGASFFGWDGGNNYRVLAFLKTLGRFDFRTLTAEERRAKYREIDAMPSWPRLGSLRVIAGAVVVKFGPYSELQKEAYGLNPPPLASP